MGWLSLQGSFLKEELFSEINWSHENGVMAPTPSIVGYYTGPAAPVNLRVR